MKTSRRPKLSSRWRSLRVFEVLGINFTSIPKFVVNDVQVDSKSRSSARLWLKINWRNE